LGLPAAADRGGWPESRRPGGPQRLPCPALPFVALCMRCSCSNPMLYHALRDAHALPCVYARVTLASLCCCCPCLCLCYTVCNP
jgi:hypothetical protein